jgi:hypothetical protein
MRELLAAVLMLGVLFPSLQEGQRLGTLRLESDAVDARGRTVPAGVYSVRYVRQPPLKDHVDTAEHVDFGLLLPMADERETWTVPELVAKGREAGGGHPWVLELRAPRSKGTIEVGPVGVVVTTATPDPSCVKTPKAAPCTSSCAKRAPCG